MILHGHSNFSYAVCDFQSMKSPVGLNSVLSKFCYFVISPGCYISLIDAKLDDLQTNKAFTSNPSVSSKQ